jgi:nickel-dependent lactate racemase
MEICLAYGKNGLPIQLPDTWDVSVVEPSFVPGLADPAGSLRQALRVPVGSPALRERVGPGDRVGVVFSDITRPTPNHLLIPTVLAELDGLPRENITLFNALGTHRPNTEAELRGMLGDDVVDGWRIVQNNAFDPATQVRLGVTSRGNEIRANRELVECDLKILTGFIEPHFFAGFSGGGKALIPGMGGQETVLRNHNASMIGNPGSAWGVTHGNPIWEEIREAAGYVDNLFLLNVTLNRDKQITAVFAGDLDQAHAAGCEFVRETAMAPVSHPYDIVITSNSGYPLDLNLYQAVKGMSAAAQVVRPGGAILIAAECWDGIPDHGLFGELLRESDSPRSLLDKINSPGFLKQDQWQAQIQAHILLKAEVYVYSDYLTDAQIESALFKPCRSIEATTAELVTRFGPQPSICVLPEGPQTIPYLQTVHAPA